MGKCCVVLGLGPAGLFLSRQLHKSGATVYGIGKPDDIGRFSNTLKRAYVAEQAGAFRACIDEILSEQVNVKPIAYICSDQYLTLIIEETPEVFHELCFETPNEELLRLIANKDALIKSCRQWGVKFPMEYAVEDLSHASFPLAIKPNIKRGHSPIPKINFVENKSELEAFIAYASARGVTKEELIFQQCVLGDNSCEYGYGGYFIKGKPIIDCCFVQARQYPQGVSCYTIEVMDENIRREIRNVANPFLLHTSYSGFLQYDLKRDCRTGEIYVLDVNPRPWGSISMLTAKCSPNGLFSNEQVESTNQVCWRFPLKEIMALRNPKNVSYSVCRKLRKKRRKMVVDLWDKKDLKPFLMQPFISFMKILRR